MIKMTTRMANDASMAKLRSINDSTAAIQKQIDRDSKSIARSMQMVHGGKWNVFVDHHIGLVAVSRAVSD